MNVHRQYLLKASPFIIFSMVAFVPKITLAEDPNPIKLENPTKYSYEYVNKYEEVVKNTLEVEKICSNKIKFVMETIFRDHVCDVSGEAHSTSENSQDYEFVYRHCHLHLKVSDDNESITSSDTGDMCPQYFCGFQGHIGGYVFKKDK